jgi:hypothetical protein
MIGHSVFGVRQMFFARSTIVDTASLPEMCGEWQIDSGVMACCQPQP